MAFQLVWDYFMPIGQGIMFIVHLYLHFLCKCFLRIFFSVWLNMKKKIKYIYFTHRWDTNLYYEIRLGINGKWLHIPQITRNFVGAVLLICRICCQHIVSTTNRTEEGISWNMLTILEIWSNSIIQRICLIIFCLFLILDFVGVFCFLYKKDWGHNPVNCPWSPMFQYNKWTCCRLCT